MLSGALASLRASRTILTRRSVLLPFAPLQLRCYKANIELRTTTQESAPKQAWLVSEPQLRSSTKEQTQTKEERWKSISNVAATRLEQWPPADAYTGRSVKVNPGNVAEAFTRLNNTLQRNRIKYRLRLTERHEKKGVKRRRLRSERWRRRFADEVRKKVQLVMKIRNRGA